MFIWISLLSLTHFVWRCNAAYDVDEKALQYLAHHLTEHKCNQLIEALRSEQLFLRDILNGTGLANKTCMMLLEKWNQEETREASFVRLVGRLRELKLDGLASLISLTVFKERRNFAKELLVPDQLTTHFPNNEPDAVIFLNSPSKRESQGTSHLTEFSGRGPKEKVASHEWTVAQTVLVVISSVGIVALFGCWLVSCVPDCCRSLSNMLWRRTRANPDDAAHFLLADLEDADA